MQDYNAAVDPALVKKEDLVRRNGPTYVDYAYQASAPLSPFARQTPTQGPHQPTKILRGLGSRVTSTRHHAPAPVFTDPICSPEMLRILGFVSDPENKQLFSKEAARKAFAHIKV